MSSPLPEPQLLLAISQVRFGVAKSEGLQILCDEVFRARAEEARAKEALEAAWNANDYEELSQGLVDFFSHISGAPNV